MRIAFYAPLKPPGHGTPSGDRRMARALMAALEAGGHEVAVASGFRSYEGAGDRDRQQALRDKGAAEAARLIGEWEALPPDQRPQAWFTYHLYHKAPDWIGPAVADRFRIPYLVAEASHAPKRAGGPWNMGYRAAEAAIRRADAVLCMTRLDRACVEPLVRDPRRLIQLPPFLEAGTYLRAAEDRDDLRRGLAAAHGLEADKKWLLAVAMMRPGDKLASYRALAAALDGLGGDDWRLLVAGDGEAGGEVKGMFAGLGSKVRWLGRQEAGALPALYAAADLYVWPAVGEAYGMAFLEAQASGLPVVAGNERGVPDVVQRDRTGLLIPPGDASAFAAALRRLLDDDGARRAMGRRAMDFVANERSPARAAEILNAALEAARKEAAA